jgi:hypothetical protein
MDNSPSSDRLDPRYTAFPNLCALFDVKIPSISTQIISESPFSLPKNVSREPIILSWGFLLRGYTGIDQVLFKVDGQPVCVDFENDYVKEYQKRIGHEQLSQHTAVYTVKVLLLSDISDIYTK